MDIRSEQISATTFGLFGDQRMTSRLILYDQNFFGRTLYQHEVFLRYVTTILNMSSSRTQYDFVCVVCFYL
jgi:hypothetical protein